MKKYLLLLIAISFLNSFSQINKDSLISNVYFLASQELKGRMTGSPEEKKAAEFIKNKFVEFGLKPAFGESYFQTFEFTYGVEVDKKSYLEINSEKIKIGEDFSILGFSGNLEGKAEVVFAGYGIEYKKFNIDDYAGLDVANKIVLVLRGAPKIDSSDFEYDKRAEIRSKAQLAKEKGAIGMFLINTENISDDKLLPTRYDRSGNVENFGIVHLKTNTVKKYLPKNLDIKNLLNYHAQKEKKYLGERLFIAKIKIELNKIIKNGTNVVAILEAKNAKEFIIIGAHYDHLGMGEFGSLYRGEEKLVHPGADDNASGVAMTIELARVLSARRNELKRTVIFAAFSGEELGLLGSTYLANNFPIDLKDCAAMINMDMIGRMNENNDLLIYGSATAKEWKEILKNANEKFKFNLTLIDDGFGPSDHSSFYAKQIPVLNFFTGSHQDYHRPTDTPEKLNYEKYALTGEYILNVVFQILRAETKFEYVSVPRRDQGGRMTLRTYIGIMPDFTENSIGFKIMGVSEGSPAQKAGLKGGDIIVKFGEYKIKNIYDYMSAMSKYSPGDKVKFLIQRNDNQIELEVELAGR